MRDFPRILTGIFFILCGLGLIVVIISSGSIILAGLSLMFLILGIYILQNKNENKIEEVKKK